MTRTPRRTCLLFITHGAVAHAQTPALTFTPAAGARVEDTIVITTTGCESLTPDLPRTLAEIEAFMKKQPAAFPASGQRQNKERAMSTRSRRRFVAEVAVAGAPAGGRSAVDRVLRALRSVDGVS
jgi:hypothetical protein